MSQHPLVSEGLLPSQSNSDKEFPDMRKNNCRDTNANESKLNEIILMKAFENPQKVFDSSEINSRLRNKSDGENKFSYGYVDFKIVRWI